MAFNTLLISEFCDTSKQHGVVKVAVAMLKLLAMYLRNYKLVSLFIEINSWRLL